MVTLCDLGFNVPSGKSQSSWRVALEGEIKGIDYRIVNLE